MSVIPTPVEPDAHAAAFRAVWLARYDTLRAAADLAAQTLARAAGNEPLQLRMQLMQQRLAPHTADAVERYHALAARMAALGDRSGSLIAKSFAAGAQAMNGDAAGALAAYEQLIPEIHRLPDPLEQHVAMGPSLALYQAGGNLAAYMQQTCRMLHLANEIDHSGMRSAAISNLGIAFFLAGDDLQARTHLEESLASTELGGWLRFGAVGILAEVYAAANEVDKVLPLLRAWSFPGQPDELDGLALAHFHALGAEVFARLGDGVQTQAYLDYLASMPAELRCEEVRCVIAVAQAKHDMADGRPEPARAALAEAVALAQLPRNDRLLAPRFWWQAAEVAAALGDWEQAYRLLERGRRLELERRHDLTAVRRVAAQYQTDDRARAVEAAQRDPLTGLGNRERLVAVGDAWIARHRAPLVAMLNVRRFNKINEAVGREIGDAVLQAVADRLKRVCTRFDHAIAGRVYADQFVIVAADGDDDLRRLQQMAAEVFATALDVAGQAVDISAAWGLAQGPAHGTSMHLLMSHAEIALHHNRRADGGLTVYDGSLVRADPRQLSLISELRRAAQNDEFTLLLQPKFRLADDTVTSFESLIRWDHPARGRVEPAAFIPFAESTGSIKLITEWVVREAMRCSCRLREAGLVCRIAVNVSTHDVGSEGFRDRLAGLLAQTGARAGDIRLELTESAAMRDPATVVGTMRAINALGFEWAVDDFGTGQSSLAYLHTLPVSELKIDRSFVRGASSSPTALALLKAAIDLGRTLGLTTVGEGAETAQEWALLRELGCEVAQGWFGARPMAEADLVPWLQKR